MGVVTLLVALNILSLLNCSFKALGCNPMLVQLLSGFGREAKVLILADDHDDALIAEDMILVADQTGSFKNCLGERNGITFLFGLFFVQNIGDNGFGQSNQLIDNASQFVAFGISAEQNDCSVESLNLEKLLFLQAAQSECGRRNFHATAFGAFHIGHSCFPP